MRVKTVANRMKMKRFVDANNGESDNDGVR